MRGAWRQIAVVQVVRLDATFDESAHQRFERRRIVVDAAQQHRLADERNAGVGEFCAGRARLRGQFARMVRMYCDPGRGALDLQRIDQRGGHPSRIGDRNTRVDADDLHVGDACKVAHDGAQAPCRQHQGIAAGQDHFPNFRMCADVGQCLCVGLLAQRGLLAWSDHLAAETETAIDRTHVHQLEQHAIRVAMDDAGDR